MTRLAPHGYFERLYADGADPYGTRDRWYEQRKRDTLLASLPRRRFRRCYEPGCGTGELTLALAARCGELLASDFSAEALRSARARLAGTPQARIEQRTLPGDWPCDQVFDLVVFSELLYFLPLASVEQLARQCAATLDEDGVLVACDWRPWFAQRVSASDAVHGALASIGLPLLVEHVEDDFVLRVWARDPRSVAQREGIR